MSELNSAPSAWWWHPDIDPATLGQFLTDNKGRLISLKSYLKNGQRRYAAFWIKNEGVSWWWNPDVDPASLGQMLTDNKGRLISLDTFVVNGQLRCAAVWVENKGTSWWWNPDVDAQSLGEMLEDNKGRLITLRAFQKGNTRRYAAVWVENKGTSWWWHPDVDIDTLGTFLANNKGRLVSLDTFVVNGKRRFAGVWHKNDDQVWWWNSGMPPAELGEEFDLFCSYPMDLVAWEDNGAVRTASVRYQHPLPAVANGIPGLSISATTSLKTLTDNGDQVNTVQLNLQNTGTTALTIEDMNVSPIASGGYLTYWWDPYMAIPAWQSTGGLINPGGMMTAPVDLGSPGDRTHFLVQARSKDASGKYRYHSEAIPITTGAAQAPAPVETDPPVMLALWTKPAEIYPVWRKGTRTDWMVVAGQIINISGKDIRLAGMGMRLTWGGKTVVEKALDIDFYNWADAPTNWWKKLDLAEDQTLKGSFPWAHFLHGMGVDLPENGISGHLHVWLNYKIDGQCGTATWDSEVVYVNPSKVQVPLVGTWRWGNSGDHSKFNGHTWPGHRFDIDLTKVGENGKTYDDNDGKLAFKDAPNTAFYAWNEPIYAMRDGVVLDAAGGNADNNGNTALNPLPPPNFVLVEHSDGSIGAYYHLRQGSLQVNIGDPVKAGDILGNVGNSGGSSEPHLHLGYVVPRNTGVKTLNPMEFSGLFAAEGLKKVTGHPGTNIYLSMLPVQAQSLNNGCLGLGFLRKKTAPAEEARPAPVRLSAAQLASLRHPVVCHCNFEAHFAEQFAARREEPGRGG